MPIQLSGSLVVTGSITTTGGITISGSIASASFAGDTALFAGKPVTVFPTTGSNTFVGSQTITGSVLQSGSLSVNGCIVSTGQIIAQTINVQQVTSSVVYSCGSNIFGCAITDVQQMTGSVRVTGSLNTIGSACSTMTNASCIGIGTTTPSVLLDVYKCTASNININSTNLYINQGNLIQFCQNTTGGTVVGYIGHAGDSTGDLTIFNGGTKRISLTSTGIACFACQKCAPGMDIMPSGIGVSTLGGLMRVVTTGTSTGIAIGQSNANRYTHFAANDIQVINDDYFITTRCAFPLSIGTCYTARLTFTATGEACFACMVCTPYINSSGGGIINTTSNVLTFYNSGGGGNAKRFGLCMTNGDIFKIYSQCDNGTTRKDNVIIANIDGAVGLGTATTSTESNLFLGAQGTIEGGQLTLQKGTSCSCATHLDNYQDSFRILVGSDTTSTGVNMVLDHKTRNVCFYGGIIAGAVYATSGYVNETQTISTSALVYSFNKDQGAAGGSSSTTFNITGLPNADGAFAFIFARSSNTAAGINVGMTIQVNGNNVFSTSTQNVTKCASFAIFRQNGTWTTSAAGTGGVLGYP